MKKNSHILTLLMPVAAFITVLLVMNGYQYFKLKNDLATGIVEKVSIAKIEELRSFFTSIDEKLQMVRDWGENDVLFTKNRISLNKKFIPMLEHQKFITAVVIANNGGQEYFLYKNKQGYLTRSSAAVDGSNSLLYEQWSGKEKVIKSWRETSDYDPRDRPWFVHSQIEKKVIWSEVYTFFYSQELGVTASVSWESPETPGRYTVFAMDIPLAAMQLILSRGGDTHPGVFFLVSGEGYYLIASDKENELEVSDNVLLELIKEWQVGGGSDGDLVKKGLGGKQWLASFQKVEHGAGLFWLGYAAQESELVDLLAETLLSTDIIDLLIATSGAILALALMWKLGMLRVKTSSVPSPIVRLERYIKQGEGGTVEFKSTIRTNLKTGKKGKEIEFAWLKALVAFLNSNGGTLILGVTDSGEICGVDADAFENSDRCLLHVKNLINQHVGAEFYSFLVVTLVEVDDKEMVMLECRLAGRPVFLKIGKNEEFYIRSGPSSTKLSPSQMMNFVQKRNG